MLYLSCSSLSSFFFRTSQRQTRVVNFTINSISLFSMTILLTGGSGKTATRVAALLAADKKSFFLGSRQGPDAASHGYRTVKFDMGDESTWTEPFRNTQIEAVYLMEPRIEEPWVPMNKFVDLAKNQGVKRFVLCAGTSAAIGKDGMGRVWEHFIKSGVDYCVLRPSWFMGMWPFVLALIILNA
jgi:festuclavine dehydrogenase